MLLSSWDVVLRIPLNFLPFLRIPEIDSSSKEGKRPNSLQGVIKFENIFFNYPSRKDVPILQGLDLEIPKGKTVALVGSSGCGKSTCIQLVQRFYDPDQGKVTLDGTDIKVDFYLKKIKNNHSRMYKVKEAQN